MKTINNFINEKLKISSNSATNEYIDKFMKHFKIKNVDKKETRKIIQEFVINNPFKDNIKDLRTVDFCATPFEMLTMFAAILIESNLDISYYNMLGYKNSPAKTNPYDFSWFDSGSFETDDGTLYYDPCEFVQYWIEQHEDSFRRMYDFVKKHNIKPDDIWDAYNDLGI